LYGAVQLTTTKLPSIKVVGVAGTEGSLAAIIAMAYEYELYPTLFLASTLN